MTDEQAALRRPFGPDDLRPLLQARQIDWTVLVQTRSSLDETRDFLAIADQTDFVAGVVGLGRPDGARRRTDVLAELKASPTGQLAGRDPASGPRRARPRLAAARRTSSAGSGQSRRPASPTICCCKPRELPAALQVARAFPDLRLVIDHIAKPEIAQRRPGAVGDAIWRRSPSCRTSPASSPGMVTEADWQRWKPADLQPYVERVVGWFGEDRLLFGSDWPVCTLAAPYEQVHDALAEVLTSIGMSDAAQAKIFGENARRFYVPGT